MNCAVFIRSAMISRWPKNRSSTTKTMPIISIVGGEAPAILALRKFALTILFATSVKRSDSRFSAR